jgi:hypothetical protein
LYREGPAIKHKKEEGFNSLYDKFIRLLPAVGEAGRRKGEGYENNQIALRCALAALRLRGRCVTKSEGE